MPSYDDDPTDNELIESVQEPVKSGIRRVAPGSSAACHWDRFCAIYNWMISRMAKSLHLPPDEAAELENEV